MAEDLFRHVDKIIPCKGFGEEGELSPNPRRKEKTHGGKLEEDSIVQLPDDLTTGGQAAGPDLGPEVTPEASEIERRLTTNPSPGPEIAIGHYLEAHRTRGAGPGTRIEQFVSKAHPKRRCRMAPGLTGCAVE
ncbi:hypothetical protein MRX96_010258 [Rhipicephalus microplus]